MMPFVGLRVCSGRVFRPPAQILARATRPPAQVLVRGLRMPGRRTSRAQQFGTKNLPRVYGGGRLRDEHADAPYSSALEAAQDVSSATATLGLVSAVTTGASVGALFTIDARSMVLRRL